MNIREFGMSIDVRPERAWLVLGHDRHQKPEIVNVNVNVDSVTWYLLKSWGCDHDLVSLHFKCPQNLKRRYSSKKLIRRRAPLLAGLPPRQPSSKRLVTYISRQQTLSSSTSSFGKQEMHSPEKQNAESSAKKLTKPPMHGGMLRKPTNEDFPIVCDS